MKKRDAAAFALAMLAQMALTDPGHTSLGAQTGPAYGAAHIADTDPAALTQSISAQLIQAGLNVPKMNLFPASALKGQGWMAPGLPASITGFSADNRFYQAVGGDLSVGFYRGQPACAVDELQRQNAKVDLVEIALHEVTHYVSYRFRFDETVSRLASADASEGAVDRANVRERIADAGAALYLLSNFSDRAEIDAELQARADVLKARVFDPGHDTLSSIFAARDAFDAAPRHGLSIVETTRWAAAIVARQPAQALDVRPLASGEVRYREALDARGRFCGLAA